MSKTVGHRRKHAYQIEMWGREASEAKMSGWSNTKENRKHTHRIKRRHYKDIIKEQEENE